MFNKPHRIFWSTLFVYRNSAAEQFGNEAAVQHACHVAGGGLQGTPESQGQVCW